MPKHGKNYNANLAKVDTAKLYAPKEAMELVKELATAKFDETVEVSIRLGVDAKMVSELKAGRVEYRADRYGICHVPMGKVSFDTEKLVENYAALYTEILRVKPASAKGKYVKSVAVSSTMGPGVKVDASVTRDFLA